MHLGGLVFVGHSVNSVCNSEVILAHIVSNMRPLSFIVFTVLAHHMAPIHIVSPTLRLKSPNGINLSSCVLTLLWTQAFCKTSVTSGHAERVGSYMLMTAMYLVCDIEK